MDKKGRGSIMMARKQGTYRLEEEMMSILFDCCVCCVNSTRRRKSLRWNVRMLSRGTQATWFCVQLVLVSTLIYYVLRQYFLYEWDCVNATHVLTYACMYVRTSSGRKFWRILSAEQCGAYTEFQYYRKLRETQQPRLAQWHAGCYILEGLGFISLFYFFNDFQGVF